MSRDPLYGIRLKLDRAQQQLKTLEADFVAPFAQGKPYRITPQYEVTKRQLKLVAHVDSPPPGIWGIQIGEIIHNLRSALDHLVWELVIRHTGAPPPKGSKTQFPIFETEIGYRNRSPQLLAGVAPEAGAHIAGLQPYATGEGEQSPLWRLHELSNFDKHRTIYLTGAILEGVNLNVSGVLPGLPCQYTARIPGPFIDNTVLLTMTFGGTAWPFTVPPNQVKVDGPTRLDIAFDDGCAAVAWGLVTPILHGIGGRVQRVIGGIAGEGLGVGL